MDRNDKEQAIRELSELVRKSSADPVVRMAMLNGAAPGRKVRAPSSPRPGSDGRRKVRACVTWRCGSSPSFVSTTATEEASNLYRKLVSSSQTRHTAAMRRNAPALRAEPAIDRT